MNRLMLTTAALALIGAAAHAEETLSVYHWFEYMPQELVDKFTAETGIKVTIDTYDSNEAMLASLKAGKLVEVLPGWAPVGSFADQIYAIRPYLAHVPRAVSALVDYLRRSLSPGFG